MYKTSTFRLSWLFAIVALTTIAFSANAQNRLYIEDFSVDNYEPFKVGVMLNNDVPVAGVECHVEAKGLEVIGLEKSDRFSNGQVMDPSYPTYILIYGLNNATFSGDSGAIAYLTVKALPGALQSSEAPSITLTNIVASEPKGIQVEMDERTTTVGSVEVSQLMNIYPVEENVELVFNQPTTITLNIDAIFAPYNTKTSIVLPEGVKLDSNSIKLGNACDPMATASTFFNEETNRWSIILANTGGPAMMSGVGGYISFNVTPGLYTPESGVIEISNEATEFVSTQEIYLYKDDSNVNFTYEAPIGAEVINVDPANESIITVNEIEPFTFTVTFSDGVSIRSAEYGMNRDGSIGKLTVSPEPGEDVFATEYTFTVPASYLNDLIMGRDINSELQLGFPCIIKAVDSYGYELSYPDSEAGDGLISIYYFIDTDIAPGAPFTVKVNEVALNSLDTFNVYPGTGFSGIEANDAQIWDDETESYINPFTSIYLTDEDGEVIAKAIEFNNGVVTFEEPITETGSYTIHFPYGAFTLEKTSTEETTGGNVNFNSQAYEYPFTVTVQHEYAITLQFEGIEDAYEFVSAYVLDVEDGESYDDELTIDGNTVTFKYIDMAGLKIVADEGYMVNVTAANQDVDSGFSDYNVENTNSGEYSVIALYGANDITFNVNVKVAEYTTTFIFDFPTLVFDADKFSVWNITDDEDFDLTENIQGNEIEVTFVPSEIPYGVLFAAEQPYRILTYNDDFIDGGESYGVYRSSIDLTGDNNNEEYEMAIYMLGDVNHDGVLNILDIQIMIDLVGYSTPLDELDPLQAAEADINFSNDISIVDLDLLISLVKNSNVSTQQVSSKLITDGYNNVGLNLVSSENGKRTYAMYLDNQTIFRAGQLDITTTGNAEVVSVSGTERIATHDVYSFNNSDYTRVLLVSMNNAPFVGDRGDLLFVTVEGEGELNLRNIIFVDTRSEGHSLIESTATGVDSVLAGENGIEMIYDAAGRTHNRIQQGINIIRHTDGTVTKELRK